MYDNISDNLTIEDLFPTSREKEQNILSIKQTGLMYKFHFLILTCKTIAFLMFNYIKKNNIQDNSFAPIQFHILMYIDLLNIKTKFH